MIENEIETVGSIPKCIKGIGMQDECLTIAYGIVGPREDWIDHTLDFVALQNNLNRTSDIVQLDIEQPQDFSNFIKLYPNRTQVGVVFCTTNYPVYGDIAMPCNRVA